MPWDAGMGLYRGMCVCIYIYIHWGYIGIMENEIATSFEGLGFGVDALVERSSSLVYGRSSKALASFGISCV